MGHLMAVRVALVDDHALFRQTLAGALTSADQGLHIVYEGEDLVALSAVEPAPDVVLLDLDLGDHQAQPEDVAALMERGIRVLVVSALGSAATVKAMVDVGVAGFLSKREDTASLLEAVHAVAAGGTWTSPEVAGILASEDSARPHLSPQEKRVLLLYTSGLKLDAVAHHLGIRPSTAREYLERIRVKYHDTGRDAGSKTKMYQQALKDGLIEPPQ